MENKRFLLLLSLMMVTLLVSLISFVTITSRLPGSGQKKNSGYSADILETQPHLYSSGAEVGPAIARIGEKKITKAELIEQFKILPPEMIVPFVTRADTLNFLRQYIDVELVYQQGLEQGLGQDSSVLAKTGEAKKQFIIEKYLASHLRPESLPPSDQEISQYYEFNRSKLGGQKLEAVRAEIAAKLWQQHRRAAYQNLVDQLWNSANIQIYEDSL